MFAFIVIVLGGGSNNVAVIYVEELSACFLQEFYSIWPYIYYSIWSLILGFSLCMVLENGLISFFYM